MTEENNKPLDLEAQREIYNHFKRLGCFDPAKETAEILEILACYLQPKPTLTAQEAEEMVRSVIDAQRLVSNVSYDPQHSDDQFAAACTEREYTRSRLLTALTGTTKPEAQADNPREPAPRPMKLRAEYLADEALEMFKERGIVFKGEGGAWEGVAFDLYNMMVSVHPNPEAQNG